MFLSNVDVILTSILMINPHWLVINNPTCQSHNRKETKALVKDRSNNRSPVVTKYNSAKHSKIYHPGSTVFCRGL